MLTQPGATVRRYVSWTHDRIVGVDYRWERQPWGDPNVAVLPDHRRDLEAGEIVTLGPYRLRVIGWSWQAFGPVVMCDGLRARLWAVCWPVAYRLRWIKTRLVLTADLWGLGRTPEACEARWTDVYAVAWWVRKWRESTEGLIEW